MTRKKLIKKKSDSQNKYDGNWKFNIFEVDVQWIFEKKLIM
jgi:hypothetical protein